MRGFALSLLLLVLLSWSGPAGAYMSMAIRPGGCDGYTDMPRSSAFDMVARADAIIVAEAGATAPPIPEFQEADYHPPRIPLRRLRVLKGEGPDRFDLELGFFTGGPAGADRVNVCQPFQPVRGGRYVLFLSRAADGTWRILPASGADVAAPYGGPESRWTRLIEDYVTLLEAPPEAAQQGLEAGLRRDLIPGADADRQWRARHALDHLTGAFSSMPTAHLLRLVADAEQGRPSPWGGRPDRTSDWPELAWSDFDNRPWVTLLAGTGIEMGAAEPERRREQALLALTTGHHPAAAPFFLERAARERSMDNAGWAVRYLALQGRRGEALDLLLRDFAAFAYPFSERPDGRGQGVGLGV
ncbi:hypothetical protein [Niveispirillum sp. KHB5.9]|uniref:hypothetical protein n=1 Tax=Niveispirillum sp. KHB5.9 TaxID=3400269 RepID=UPI003A8C214B